MNDICIKDLAAIKRQRRVDKHALSPGEGHFFSDVEELCSQESYAQPCIGRVKHSDLPVKESIKSTAQVLNCR